LKNPLKHKHNKNIETAKQRTRGEQYLRTLLPVRYRLVAIAHLSVCLLERLVSQLWKTADWIWMPFTVVSGVGRKMGVLRGVVDRRWKGAVFEVNVGQWNFVA